MRCKKAYHHQQFTGAFSYTPVSIHLIEYEADQLYYSKEQMMQLMARYTTWFNLVLLNLMTVSSAIAQDQAAPQTPPWPGWHSMPWHGFGWFFPLLFIVVMIVMCFLMMRRGCMGCRRYDRTMRDPDSRDASERPGASSTESAQTILDKRYASGEIEKQEYEEKKAALRSG
jgi:uncharacterized membrane protein